MNQLNKATTSHIPEEVNTRLLERAEIVAQTVISQQPFYASAACTPNQRQLLETMIGAAIWYFPQGEGLWTGAVSVAALTALAENLQPNKIRLTIELRTLSRPLLKGIIGGDRELAMLVIEEKIE